MNTNSTDTLAYLNQQLVDAVELARTAGTNAFDFLQVQAPEITSQLLAYNSTMLWLRCIFGLALILLALLTFRSVIAKMNAPSDTTACTAIVCFFLAIVCTIVGLSVFLAHVEELIKITFAPKVWLIEYVAGLINGK